MNKKIYLSKGFIVALMASLIASALFYARLYQLSVKIDEQNQNLSKIEFLKVDVSPTPNTSDLTVTKTIPNNKSEANEWGIARQISEYTWTMRIGHDEVMAIPNEIHEALNNYRNDKGVGSLSWDEGLASFAKTRADFFAANGALDEHEGFRDYVENGDNMQNLGFWGLGENSSIGFKLSGVHLIEWIFAGDPPHDNNQLDPSWTHVGIGVNGTAVDVIFGKK